MHEPVFKKLIPERGGVINLPVCARIISVDFQRWRPRAATPTPQTFDRADSLVAPGAADTVQYAVGLTDMRSGQKEMRTVVVVDNNGAEVTIIEGHYTALGFTVDSTAKIDDPVGDGLGGTMQKNSGFENLKPGDLVGVLYFIQPDVGSVGYDIEAWPKVDISVAVIPTGDAPPAGFTFVGTLSRPQRRDPTKDAAFHVFVNGTDFITVATR